MTVVRFTLVMKIIIVITWVGLRITAERCVAFVQVFNINSRI